MKKIWIAFVVLILLNSQSLAQVTAKINVTITDMNFMSLERYSFFKADDEVNVENKGAGKFLVNYYGKKPKLFVLNFREVLVSPGDSINLEFKVLDNDPNHHRDTIIASGRNKDNYNVSNLFQLEKVTPKGKFPDYKLPKYQKNIRLLYTELEDKRKTIYDNIAAKLGNYSCDKEFTAYLLRGLKRQLLYDLFFLEDNINDLEQKKVFRKLVDSVFLNNEIVKADTAYSYLMEMGFKNYFGFVAKRYGNLKTEKDVVDIVNFMERFPNDFISTYFVYFLATDYPNAIARYKIPKLDNLISANPYIGRTRTKPLDKSKTYPIN